MPCSPLTVDIPDTPSGTPIPGFGVPFALKLPEDILPSGFPEDLLDLFNKLNFLTPPGSIKPQLNPNFGKDVFDAIMKMLDQFFPFLMLYKFFLPVLQLIICIIEVLCSLTNPPKLIAALSRLFRVCLPEFLNLFPVFAFILMILSLLLLLLELILYIIEQILKLVNLILRNIKALYKAYESADEQAINAIVSKLSAILCQFQNLFVLLALFNIIFQIIKDILRMAFAIPPCDDGTNGDESECCTPDVCPQFISNGNYDRKTGSLRYLNSIQISSGISLPAPYSFNVSARDESIQFYDVNQTQVQQFINIINAFDAPLDEFGNKPIFFPTDAVYDENTPPKQSAYLVDLRMLYNPLSFGRTGEHTRYVRFKDCIVVKAPTDTLKEYDNSTKSISSGVLLINGGYGTEDDGTTRLSAYEADGITKAPQLTATLNNFIHMPDQIITGNPVFLPTDGYAFSDVEYTFKINHSVLQGKNIITAGCFPGFKADKQFTNSVFAGEIGVKLAQLRALMDKPAGQGFPDTNSAQECLTTALSGLRANLTEEGVANFQASALLCMDQLQKDTEAAIGELVGVGFDNKKSSFELDTNVQFVSGNIVVSALLKETNGTIISASLPSSIASDLANKFSAKPTLGNISQFSYDGYQAFIATLTSDKPGSGEIKVSFDNKVFTTVNIPTNLSEQSTITDQILTYQFIHTSTGVDIPRRDEGDTSRDNGAG